MKIFKNTISALAVLSLLVGGFFINTGTALAAAAPFLSGTMTFANRTVSVFGNTVTFDLIGVTDADLTSLGNISLYSNNAQVIVSFKVNSPTPIYQISLKTGDNAINTPTLFGKYMTASELSTMAAIYGGTIPVTGTITNSAPASISVTFNMVVTANFASYNSALNSVIQADYTPASWAAYQTFVAANVVTTSNTQAQVDTAAVAITTAQGSLITLAAQAIADQATATAVVAAYEAAPITTLTEVTTAEGLKAGAIAAVAIVTDATINPALTLRINNRAATIATARLALQAIADATAAVTTATLSNLPADLAAAQALVLALPAADQVALQASIDAVQIVINTNTNTTAQLAITNATAAVTLAETSKTQANINAAQLLINGLPTADQIALQSRIGAVRIPTTRSNGGSSTYIPTVLTLETQDQGCAPGYLFSSTSGKHCTEVLTPVVTTIIPTVGEVLGVESFNFTLPIKLGSKGNEIMELQKFLNGHNFIIALTGPGSKGKETTTFGPMTKKALAKFQVANKLKGDGVVGPTTRAFLNK